MEDRRVKRTRPHKLIFCVNDEEYRIIKAKISKGKTSQQNFLLRAALDKEVVEMSELIEVIRQLKMIGNNLNQLTKKINQQRELSSLLDLKRLERGFEETWRQLNLSLAKLK